MLRSLSCSPPLPSLASGMDIDLGVPARSSLLAEAHTGVSSGSGASMTGSVVLPSDLCRSLGTKPPEAKGGGGMVDDRGPVMGLATASYASAPGARPTSSGRTLGELHASRRREILAVPADQAALVLDPWAFLKVL